MTCFCFSRINRKHTLKIKCHSFHYKNHYKNQNFYHIISSYHIYKLFSQNYLSQSIFQKCIHITAMLVQVIWKITQKFLKYMKKRTIIYKTTRWFCNKFELIFLSLFLNEAMIIIDICLFFIVIDLMPKKFHVLFKYHNYSAEKVINL